MNPVPAITARLLAAFLLLIGLGIAAGGVRLLMLGGSPYYLLGGLAVAAVAVLLWRADRRSALLYGAFMLVTLGWALWEVGLDGWQLMPRLVGPAVIGLLFLLPGVRRTVGRAAAAPAAAGVAVLLVMLAAALQPGPDSVPDIQRPASPVAVTGDPAEWTHWGGTLEGQRFSALDQITPRNVKALKLAWTFRTGVDKAGSPLQATPIMVGNALYLCTQTNVVIAVDPETGKERWRFDPKVDPAGASAVRTCRGVAYYRVPAAPVPAAGDVASVAGSTSAAPAADCPERIITATFGAQLIALDAHTGKPCPSFGKDGFVDLKEGMGEVLPGFYYVSSAPTIVQGNVIVGGWVADNQSADEPSGVIRAFDAVTGKLAWAWDAGNPANRNGPPPGQWYTRSTPNSWAPMSGDEALGLVYVPTGNPAPDYFGRYRIPASEKYGSSVLALDARTGDVRWSFQTAHHDLWDYDVASQPTLLDVNVNGQSVPALAQATKRGELFLLDRRTGKPLARVEERPAPQKGAAPEEQGRLARTQPYSVGMPSFAGGPLTERNMWGLTPLDQLWCRIRFRQLRYDGHATPPGTDESLIFPSIGGGMNWGGVAYDPDRRIMIVNTFFYGTIVQLVPRAETDRILKAASEASGSDSHSTTDFAVPIPQLGTPYGALQSGLISPLNVLCNAPPFGTMSAVDMNTRKVLWTRPVGTAQDSGPFGMSLGLPIPMGLPGWGGALVTRGGLTFLGHVKEKAFRAFDTNTGKELWKVRIPASANANPMTYVSPKSGRQFVVVAATGHVMLQSLPLGDTFVAYALPEGK